jgi:TPR repeat protein
VILTGLFGSGGAVWADDFDKGWAAEQAGDYAEAVKWYCKDAEQGYARAQSNLGVMYHKGKGVLQDTVAAHMWFNIAAEKGAAVAVKIRDIVAKLLLEAPWSQLSSTDIVEAQKRAKRCMASGYKDCD